MPRKNNLNFQNISAGIICVLIVSYIINRPVADSSGIDSYPVSLDTQHPANSTDAATDTAQSIKTLQQAFLNKQSDLQIQAQGIVLKTLPDDTKGSRHQRFILRVSPSQTVLVAHNIDLAPKISNLKKGDLVEFYGEYEWNAKGGVIHWTHHDPGNKHIDGWLKHKGNIYQ